MGFPCLVAATGTRPPERIIKTMSIKKKIKGRLAAFVCVLALTACGGTSAGTQEEIPEETRNNLFSLTESTVQQMDEIVSAQLIEDQKSHAVVYNGLKSWESAKEAIGSVDFSADADSNGSADCFEDKSISVDDEGNYIVTVGVTGKTKKADVVITYPKDISDYANIATNVEYSFSELIQQAGMNTLLGMGTTFAVLILLCLIIAAFGKILAAAAEKRAEAQRRKMQEEQDKKAALAKADSSKASSLSQGAPAGSAGPASADNMAAAMPGPGGIQDEGALVAVLTAAVAAYESEKNGGVIPAADPDTFLARRIRRTRKR